MKFSEVDTNRGRDNCKNTLEGQLVLSTYMTHTLPINGTQKKEHILMVKKKEFSSMCLYSGCVHDREKESPDLVAELNVYV